MPRQRSAAAPDPTSSGARELPSVRVGLQAIHDSARSVVAYELLFRAPGADAAVLTTPAEHDHATASVLSSTFGEFGAHDIAGGHPLFLNTTRPFFTGQLPLPVAPDGVVLELLETITVDDELLAGLRSLRERGFVIAVDDFAGEPERLPALSLARFVKIDIEAVGDRLEELIAMARRVNADVTIVAERVETQAQFDLCRALGAELFQGYFLHRPTVVQRPTLTATSTTCIRLLAALTDPDVPVQAVLDLLALDPALSVRLLRTASSSAYAPRAGITSLRQAVTLLGRREISAWVTLTLIAGTSSSPRISEASLTTVFARAAGCRLLVPDDADAAYTAGLLSGAAQALGLCTRDFLRGCTLAPSVHDALVDQRGPIGRALQDLLAHELLFSGTVTLDPPPDGGSWGGSWGGQDVSHAHLVAHRDARITARHLLAGSRGDPTTSGPLRRRLELDPPQPLGALRT